MTFTFTNKLTGAGVALTAVTGLYGAAPLPPASEEALAALLAVRKAPELPPAEEKVRAECRNMLRNGSYKPTGRGKPASEYLLGAAREGAFPRVGALVDINNLISLKYLLPVSIWDADLCSSRNFEFRLGRAGESYLFNQSGQALDLEDLVCGCELDGGGASLPIVTPVKDGMRTKVRPETRTAIGAVYYPAGAVSRNAIEAANAEFLERLLSVSTGARGTAELLPPGEARALELT